MRISCDEIFQRILVRGARNRMDGRSGPPVIAPGILCGVKIVEGGVVI